MTSAVSGQGHALDKLCAAWADKPVGEAVLLAAKATAARFGDAAQSVIFYGSVLRDGQLEDRILDFYVIVDEYRAAYGSLGLALANRVLPPNVFYMETPLPDGGTARAKVAVISARHLERLSGRETLNSTLWARFAQPVRLVWARDEAARDRAISALARSVRTLATTVLPLLPETFSVRQFWHDSFAQTYRAEFRAERAGKGVEIYDLNQAYFDAALAALAEDGVVEAVRDGQFRHAGSGKMAARLAWTLRGGQGKSLTIARLIKAAFTFEGGADYLAWKISRHSGVKIELTPWQRRHPVLGGLWLFIRLRRQRAFR